MKEMEKTYFYQHPAIGIMFNLSTGSYSKQIMSGITEKTKELLL